MSVNKILVNNNDSNYTHSIFDISEYTGNSYSTLSDALDDIPQAKHKGGMTIRYVPTDDNKYVQFRYVGTSTANADFTNVANWQGVDDVPIAGSKNLVKSGGVAKEIGDENIYGFYLSVINTLIADEDWGVSDYIPYTQGSNVNWHYGGAAKSEAYLVTYNSNKTKISGFRAKEQDGRTLLSSKSEFNNCSYIRASFRIHTENPYVTIGSSRIDFNKSLKDKIQIENLAIEKNAEEIKIENLAIEKNAEEIKKVELLTKGTIFSNFGGYLDNSGNVVINDEWGYTDFIPFIASTTVIWNYGGDAFLDAKLVTYDANKNKLSTFGANKKDSRTLSGSRYEFENCAYIRFSFRIKNTSASITYDDDTISVANGLNYRVNVLESIVPKQFTIPACESYPLWEPTSTTSNYETVNVRGQAQCSLSYNAFLAKYYDVYIGENNGIVVRKNTIGLDASGQYSIYEYDFIPKHYNRTLLLSAGMDPEELPGIFGVAYFIKSLFDGSVDDGLDYFRKNVRIKVIPIIDA